VHPDFWLDRWQTGEIGFHLNQTNANLLKFWSGLNVKPPAQVFVPLCGKSLDMHWLSQQGYQIVGVELSVLAVSAFFAEANLQPSRSKHGRFECWQAGNIRILCGDFFDLGVDDVAGCNFIYDRAALIALPESLRILYVEHLRRIFTHRTQGMLVVLNYPQHEMRGPPFSVAHEEVIALYRGVEIRLLHEQDILLQESRMRNKGVTSLFERVYSLVWTEEQDDS
jgi:thiopurine S-methyltransferase